MKVLVTGGTNGMGRGVAQILAGCDNQIHEVIILCRSRELGETTIKELEVATNNRKISIVLCDLARLDNVRKAIAEIHGRHEFLDAVFINAGLGYAARRVETEDGMDQHFQVNYLSQFMLTLNLLDLLDKSANGGRVVFNSPKFGNMFWDDLQAKERWGYERSIGQAMLAKRMFYVRLNDLCRKRPESKVSLFGFHVQKTVWSNQLNIIPFPMRAMATVVKWFGGFISIERCGQIMAPLFTETREESLKKSGKLITWNKGVFTEMEEDLAVFDKDAQERLWTISLDLCKDERTAQIAGEYTGSRGS